MQQLIQKPLTLKNQPYEHTYLVLLTRLKPLTIYLYKEPIIKSKSQQVSQEDFLEKLKATNDDQTMEAMEMRVRDVIIKSLLSVQSDLVHHQKSILCQEFLTNVEKKYSEAFLPMIDDICFQVLSFDILLDAGLKPWLLNVKAAPDF